MDPHVIGQAEKSTEYDDQPSLGHLVIKNLTASGDKILLVSGISGEELSARVLLARSIEVAKALKAAGIQKGDVISIASENRFELAYVLFGSILLNCTFAPINLTYTEREMTHAFNLSKPKIIFMSPFACEKVVKVAKPLSYVRKVVLIDEENPFGASVTLFNDFISSGKNVSFAPTPADKKAVSIILCSSGTTGLPKGVQLSQDNMIVVTRFAKNTMLAMEEFENDEIVVLGLMPLFHAFGLTSFVGAMACAGAKVVLLPKFEEPLFLGCIENYRCNAMTVVPPLMVFLAKHPMVDDYDISCMRSIVVGAAPLSKELEQAVYARLNNKKLAIRQGYGMSELSLATLLQQKIFKSGSVGSIIEGSIAKIIDENGQSLGPNKRGELCFKGNQMMIGYIGDDKATKDTIDEEGWLHTGDVAYYDDEQQFYIVDRIKELIKWKGFQVPPAEIEGLLLTHQKIKDAAVIGIPSEEFGELPFAFVVKQPEVDLTEKEVKQFVADNASKPKWLHGGMKFIVEIPKTISGKILRRELRDLVKNSKL